MNVIQSRDFRTMLLLLTPGTLWGLMYLVNDVALYTIPPLTFTASRNILSAMAMMLILYWRGGRLASTWAGWRPYFFLGLFDNAIPFVLISWGQVHIEGGLTTILLSLIPLFTVLLAHYFSYNEPLNRYKVFGILLGLLGIFVLVGPSALSDVGLHLWGQLAVIAGAFSYAIAAIYIRRHLRDEKEEGLNPVLRAIISQFLCSQLFVVPLMIIIEKPWTIQPSQTSLMALALSSWVIAIGAALIYYYMINRVGAATASTTLYLTPINGVFWGAVLLSEPVTWPLIIALVLILSGVAVVNRARGSINC